MKGIFVAIFTMSFFATTAQSIFPSLSPRGRVEQTVGYTNIAIDYDRPSARGRKIFGGLVAFENVWKTGAGRCTRLKFNDTVSISNTLLPAGTYSLYTIPRKDIWTIIINSDTTGWYQEKNDVVRFQVPSEPTTRFYQTLTLDIDVISNDAELNISWEKTRVAFKIETGTDKKLHRTISKDLLLGSIKDSNVYASGAEYYSFLGRDLETGIILINKALSLQIRSWYYALKVDLLTKQEKYLEAIETLELNMAYVRPNPENWTAEQLHEVLEAQKTQMNELQAKVSQ